MDRYFCTGCGYVYDPKLGDPEHGVPRGTPFEEIPENYVCPVCNAPETSFLPDHCEV